MCRFTKLKKKTVFEAAQSSFSRELIMNSSLQSTRKIILGLTLANFSFCLATLVVSVLSFNESHSPDNSFLWAVHFAYLGIFSVPVVLAYHFIETIVLFCYSISCWPLNLIFQILIILHDVGYFLTAILNVFIEFYPYEKWNNVSGSYEPCGNACKIFDIIFSALLFVSLIIETTLTVYYSKLPKRSCCINIGDISEPTLENETPQQVIGYICISEF